MKAGSYARRERSSTVTEAAARLLIAAGEQPLGAATELRMELRGERSAGSAEGGFSAQLSGGPAGYLPVRRRIAQVFERHKLVLGRIERHGPPP